MGSGWRGEQLNEFRVYEDAAGLATAAAENFVVLAREAIAARGRFLVALAGGSTPRAAYELLATEPFAASVDWTRVHLFWGDERCVPPDHPDSNYRMARETLLDRVQIPAANVHRMRCELAPQQAAAAYERELEKALGEDGRFDLILLGLGTDGHTASLFPGAAALGERERRVLAVYVEKLKAWRVTLTLPVINTARHVIFLVSGTSKAETLARVRASEPLPAGLVQPVAGRLLWLLDKDANGA
ncbi:MAG: 6-phosphogluconolactonase [Chloroflexi bacterium]|nr:6-phosphogluconolactonase [Chloroflexota bacterium]